MKSFIHNSNVLCTVSFSEIAHQEHDRAQKLTSINAAKANVTLAALSESNEDPYIKPYQIQLFSLMGREWHGEIFHGINSQMWLHFPKFTTNCSLSASENVPVTLGQNNEILQRSIGNYKETNDK